MINYNNVFSATGFVIKNIYMHTNKNKFLCISDTICVMFFMKKLYSFFSGVAIKGHHHHVSHVS